MPYAYVVDTVCVACRSFLSTLPSSVDSNTLRGSLSRLPYHRSATVLNKSRVYVTFQSNEGDTPKNAYSFRGGNWQLFNRTTPLAWGVAPIIATLFPGLWEYYVETAVDKVDQFFGATGGVGYTHPWSVPDMDSFLKEVSSLYSSYMPMKETGSSGTGERKCA